MLDLSHRLRDERLVHGACVRLPDCQSMGYSRNGLVMRWVAHLSPWLGHERLVGWGVSGRFLDDHQDSERGQGLRRTWALGSAMSDWYMERIDAVVSRSFCPRDRYDSWGRDQPLCLQQPL